MDAVNRLRSNSEGNRARSNSENSRFPSLPPSALMSRVASINTRLDEATGASGGPFGPRVESPLPNLREARRSKRTPLFNLFDADDPPGGSSPSSSRVSLDSDVLNADTNERAEASPSRSRSPEAYKGRAMTSDLKEYWGRGLARAGKILDAIPPHRAINVPYNGILYGIDKGMRYYNKRSDVRGRLTRKRKEALDAIWWIAQEKSEEYCELNGPLKKLREDYNRIDKQLKKSKLSEDKIKELKKERNEIEAKIEKIKDTIHQEARKDARLIYTKHYALEEAKAMMRSNRWWILAMFGVQAANTYMDGLIKDLIKAVLEDKW